jgi:CRISPR/Cas system-associated endonuclease Cas3-HD
VGEYWVVNVKAAKIIAFEAANLGSRHSRLLLVLPIAHEIEEALQRSQTDDDGFQSLVNSAIALRILNRI